MPDLNGTPSDVELIEKALEWFSKRLRIHLPGTVDAVHLDSSGGVVAVDVRVDVGEYRSNGTAEVPDVDPLLPKVPVEWPGAGGARLTFPIQRGDTGLLLFADKSLDEWKSNATGHVLARDKRRHCLADAVFAPGLRRLAAPWAGARTDAVTLGYETGAAMQVHITPTGIALGEPTPVDAVLLGTTYRSAEAGLHTALTTFITAIGTYVTTIAATADPSGSATTTLGTAITAMKTAISAFENNATSYLSTTVKVKK